MLVIIILEICKGQLVCKWIIWVPQGTVLGPLFFLIYINDISCGLTPGTEIRLFADDSLFYRNINNYEDTLILQRDLDQLQRWEVIYGRWSSTRRNANFYVLQTNRNLSVKIITSTTSFSKKLVLLNIWE